MNTTACKGVKVRSPRRGDAAGGTGNTDTFKGNPVRENPAERVMKLEEESEAPATGQAERRSYPRYVVEEDALLQFVDHGLPVKCRILDLSLEGCRVRTMPRLSPAMRARVEVSFSINGIAFRLSGLTEWSDERHVIGICVADMPARRKEEWGEVIREVKGAAKARKLAAARLARDLARREAKQMALPSAIAPQANLSAQREAAPYAGQVPVRRERRAQSRHEVNTSAAIFLINLGSKLTGRILDLSLSGCRIRTDERFPVGTSTRVETEFGLEGLPFRLAGVIQAIHEPHHVGIRFLDVSDRKSKQIEELIEDIQEMREGRKRTA